MPLEEIQKYPEFIEAITLNEVNEAARKYINPDKAIAVVVGDLTQIEQPVRDLNLGEVIVVDALGKPLV
jgi:zinc protease